MITSRFGLVATGAKDGELKLWNVTLPPTENSKSPKKEMKGRVTMKCISSTGAHVSSVGAVAWCHKRNSGFVVTGSADLTLKVLTLSRS